MKRYIHCTDLPEDGEALAIQTFGKDSPSTGCSFISPDGLFINIYPKLPIHEDLCDWVEDQLDIELPYKDEEYFVREFQWIRLRNDPTMMVVELPEEEPFRNQWYSLQDWLEFCEEQHPHGVSLYLNILDTNIYSVEVNFNTEYFAEDIVKMLKGYYSSGRLVASTKVR